MIPADARRRLEPLVGTALGPGDWIDLSPRRISSFGAIMGDRDGNEVPALLLLALIPGATSALILPVDPPVMTINYGIDSCRVLAPAEPRDRIRAWSTLTGLDETNGWLQLKRRVVLENESGTPVLEAETVTRWRW
jgi:hypothetical protein